MEIKSVQTQTELMTLNERVIIEAFNHKIEVKLVFHKSAKNYSYEIAPINFSAFDFVGCQNPDLTKAVAYAIHAAACRAEELIEQTKGVDDTPNEAVLIPKKEWKYLVVDNKELCILSSTRDIFKASVIKKTLDAGYLENDFGTDFFEKEAIEELIEYYKLNPLSEKTTKVDNTPNKAVLIPKKEDTQENKGYQYIDFKNIKDPTIGKGSVSLSTIKIYMDMDLSDEEIYNNFKSNKSITIEAIQEAVAYLKTQ